MSPKYLENEKHGDQRSLTNLQLLHSQTLLLHTSIRPGTCKYEDLVLINLFVINIAQIHTMEFRPIHFCNL